MKRILHSRFLKILIPIFIGCLSISVISAEQDQDVQRNIKRQNLRIRNLLQPTAKQKIATAAKDYENRVISSNWQLDFNRAAVDTVRNQFGTLPAQDTDVLVQLVMFELWKAEEDALEELLKEMHRMNQAKKRQREYMSRLKQQKAQSNTEMRQEYKNINNQQQKVSGKAKTITKQYPKMAATRRLGIRYPKTPKIDLKDTSSMGPAELEKLIAEEEQKMDSLSELSEELSLKIQILMDRRAKIIQTLSNIMKKISQTSDTIIANIK